jgi:hypothetical protein
MLLARVGRLPVPGRSPPIWYTFRRPHLLSELGRYLTRWVTIPLKETRLWLRPPAS